MQYINLHEHRVEIWHLRVDVRKISGVDRIDFGQKLRQAVGMLAELYQRPTSIQPDAVMTI